MTRRRNQYGEIKLWTQEEDKLLIEMMELLDDAKEIVGQIKELKETKDNMRKRIKEIRNTLFKGGRSYDGMRFHMYELGYHD